MDFDLKDKIDPSENCIDKENIPENQSTNNSDNLDEYIEIIGNNLIIHSMINL